MAKVIIIRGPLGCGKSTISKDIAKELEGSYHSVDTFLERYGLDAIDEKLGCIPEENFFKANEMIIQKALDDLKNDKSVVIDGNFYHKEVLESLLNGLKGFDVHVFTIKCKIDTCIKRDSKRLVSYGKKAAIAVHELVVRFDYGTLIHNDVDDENLIVDEMMKIIR